jgi:uncharacterized membrane protein YkvA (DUF1232 family)
MTERKSGKMVVPQGGMMRDVVKRLKLIARLMGDSRVNVFLKALPLASVAYLIFPFDLAPGMVFPIIGALDDAAILWLGSNLFVELCPDDVVKEHMRAIDSNLSSSSPGEVVDAEATDMDDDKR